MDILVLSVTLMHCRAPAAGLLVMNGISELETEGVKTVGCWRLIGFDEPLPTFLALCWWFAPLVSVPLYVYISH